MNVKSVLLLIAGLSIFGACTNTNIDQLSQLDPYQKTMTVSKGNGKLTGEVKTLLVQNSWKTNQTDTPVPNARYSMLLTYDQTQVCLPRFDPMYDYVLSVTDNKTGGLVYNIHGRDCSHTILDHLDAFLHNKQP